MMHRLLALLAALALAACGSPPPQSTLKGTFAGTLAGKPFNPVDATAFRMEPRACNQLGAGSYTIVWVQFSIVAGSCALATGQGYCAARAGAVTANVAVVLANEGGGTAPAIGPGTYRTRDSGLVDASGNAGWVWADVGRRDAACAALPGGPKEGGLGTVVLEEVGTARVRGTATFAFDDGSTLAGTFDAPACSAPGDELCASLKGGCTSTSCEP